MSDVWDPDFLARSPLFAPLTAAATPLVTCTDWPTPATLNALADRRAPIFTRGGKPLRFVAQGPRPRHFAERYEPRIYLTGAVQTRAACWHDVFNALVWLTFPATKASLNALHYEAQRAHATKTRQPNRSPSQDLATLFDEGGAIVAASAPALLHLVRQQAWKQLFWEARAEARQALRVYLFGHALYEKLLAPYVGLTAKALLLAVEPSFLEAPLAAQIEALDARAAGFFTNVNDLRPARALVPLPVLGVPGVFPGNDVEAFYDDTEYFRPVRRGRA